jgi:hypothetical protein
MLSDLERQAFAQFAELDPGYEPPLRGPLQVRST